MQLRWVTCLLILGLFGITSIAQATSEPKPGLTKYYKSTFNRYLEHSNRAEPPKSYSLYLQAVGRLLQDNQPQQAERMLQTLPFQTMPKPLQHEHLLLQANSLLLQGEAYRSLNILRQIEDPNSLLVPQRTAYYQLLAIANAKIKNFFMSAEARMALDPLIDNSSSQQQNREQIWQALHQLPIGELATQLRHTRYGDLQGWLELAYIYKMYKNEQSLLESERQQWQQHYTRHPANSLLPTQQVSLRSFFQSKPTITADRGDSPLQIALLLPNSGPHAGAATAIKAGFMSAYYSLKHDLEKPAEINLYDTANKNVQAVYKHAINDGANVVVGPLIKSDVATIEALGSIPVPTLGLNFTPNAGKHVTNLFEYALSPQDEARQVAKKMLADDVRHILIIFPDGAWGKDQADVFEQTLTSNGGQVIDRAAYKKNTSLDLTVKKILKIDDRNFNKFRQGNIVEETELPRRTDFDAIFMIADPVTARQIKPLLQFYFADNIPVYATSDVYTGKPDTAADRDLNGIIFCDMPFSITKAQGIAQAHQQMQRMAPDLSAPQQKLFAFGRDAYLLAVNMNPFRLSKYHSIDGLTGTLYLDKQQVLRRLQWAEFKHGVPQRVGG